MDKNERILHKILLSREQRAEKQKALIKTYNCSIISFVLNIPGPQKDSPLYRRIHHVGVSELISKIQEKGLEILYKQIEDKDTGSQAYICIDADSVELKKITVELEENHPLGRIFDLDVIDKNCKGITREMLGLSKRKCLLCDDESTICRRERKHTTEELILKINDLSDKFFCENE